MSMYRCEFWKLLCSKSIPGMGFLVRWTGYQLPGSWSSEGIYCSTALPSPSDGCRNVQGYHHINLFCLSIPLTN